MQRIYAIGDIHGQLEKLREVHRWISADRARNSDDSIVVHVGDLVDRGPDSAGVLDWLITGLARGEAWVVLKGNHDRMMSYFLERPSRRDHLLSTKHEWLSKGLGGRTTLASYGVDVDTLEDAALHEAALSAIPDTHKLFLAGLETIFQSDTAAFVHAGVRPGVPFDKQTEDDLVWIRREFHEDTRDHGALVVHGHTPVDVVTHYGNRVNIDTGAAYGRALSVVILEGHKVWQLDENGRTSLDPPKV
ncbi:MAG: metallophosphoesterase [Marinosulfonomonas sp.]|nr:metallophosphoesterase [Marinosulfonomonas sp.]